MGVSLPDYKRTHQPLGIVQGFDMDSCNSMLGKSMPKCLLSFTIFKRLMHVEILQSRCTFKDIHSSSLA